MVIILVLVGTMYIAFMIERQAAQSLTVQRQLKLYSFDHVSRGIGEAVDAWIKSNGTESVKEALAENGHAFDLEVEGGQTVRVSLFEAQGAVLAEFAGLSGPSLDAAREVLEKLVELERNEAPRFTRREGPVAVSLNSAPREVLTAVAESVLDALDADTFVSEVIRARADGDISTEAFGEVLNRSDVPQEARAELTALFTTQPVLWRIIAEADSPGGVYPPRPSIRYSALAIIINSPGGGRDRSASLQRNSSIISWEDLSGTSDNRADQSR
jgi:hypothetical protein